MISIVSNEAIAKDICCEEENGQYQFVDLQKGRVQVISVHSGERVINRGRTVWITRNGDPVDYIVRSGEIFLNDRGGVLIIQGI